jgi:hypothetical protein
MLAFQVAWITPENSCFIPNSGSTMVERAGQQAQLILKTSTKYKIGSKLM